MGDGQPHILCLWCKILLLDSVLSCCCFTPSQFAPKFVPCVLSWMQCVRGRHPAFHRRTRLKPVKLGTLTHTLTVKLLIPCLDLHLFSIRRLWKQHLDLLNRCCCTKKKTWAHKRTAKNCNFPVFLGTFQMIYPPVCTMVQQWPCPPGLYCR